MSNELYNDLYKAFDKEVFKLFLKTDIRQRYPEPEASRLCQQVDDTAILADLLEYMAKEMRKTETENVEW